MVLRGALYVLVMIRNTNYQTNRCMGDKGDEIEKKKRKQLSSWGGGNGAVASILLLLFAFSSH